MVFGRFGAKQKKQGKYSQKRRDVTTSRRRDAWLTEESQQVTQRRDITTISAPASLKARGDLISRYRRTCGFKGEKMSSSDTDHWRRHFLFVFSLF